jgi:hypothetical protein
MNNSRKKLAIQSLGLGSTVTAAAVSAGVSRKTIHLWLKDETFLQEVEATGEAAFFELSRRLVGICAKALDVLDVALVEGKVTGMQIRAVEVALSHMPRYREEAEFNRRLIELERKVIDDS